MIPRSAYPVLISLLLTVLHLQLPVTHLRLEVLWTNLTSPKTTLRNSLSTMKGSLSSPSSASHHHLALFSPSPGFIPSPDWAGHLPPVFPHSAARWILPKGQIWPTQLPAQSTPIAPSIQVLLSFNPRQVLSILMCATGAWSTHSAQQIYAYEIQTWKWYKVKPYHHQSFPKALIFF